MPDPRPGPDAVRAAVDVAARRLADAGVPSPRHDAEVLVAHTLGVTRSGLRTAPSHPSLPPGTAERLSSLVARRAAREPLQHLTGVASFRWIDVAVGPGVFVPRPETELVAGAAVDAARSVLASGRSPVVVDLCAGSGVVALAVATEVPSAVVHAVERAEAAFGWLRRNLGRDEALAPRLRLHHVDVERFLAAAPELAGTVDVVVANPPYLPDGSALDPEVAEHDPPEALFGGPDGLAGPRFVVPVAAELLRRDGVLVVEHAESQAAAVAALLGPGWAGTTTHADLTGRPRFTTARRVVGGAP